MSRISMILQNDVETSIIETDTTFTYFYLDQVKTKVYLNFYGKQLSGYEIYHYKAIHCLGIVFI